MLENGFTAPDELRKRIRKVFVVILLVVVFTLCFSGIAVAADQTGAKTGNRADAGVSVQDGGADDGNLLDAVGKTRISLNYVWMFLGAALIFFMQAGFALVETGLCQKKNALHIMMTNFMIFGIAMAAFYLVGFALMYGGVSSGGTPVAGGALGGVPILTREFSIGGWGLLGFKGFALSGPAYDVGIFLFFIFQVVFMDTAATIPTGAMAERWKFSAFCIYGIFMGAIAYPIFGNWVWGGGWLAQLGTKVGLGHGFVDFAGSSVVHAMGGLAGLMGILVLGPRFGKFDAEGKPRAIPGHNIPIAIVGAIILIFGWFGFNAVSTMNGHDLRLAVVAGNTLLASCFGAIAAMVFMWKKTGYPDPSMSMNGCLAGLVAITAPCAFVPSWAACIIGTIAGVLVCVAVMVLENRFKIDDPVGAVAVHGINGLWGVIAVGIFADGRYGDLLNGVKGGVRGLLYGGWDQLGAQVIGAVVCAAFACAVFYAFFRVQDRLQGIRVSPEVELAGVDAEMGVPAYTDETPDLYYR